MTPTGLHPHQAPTHGNVPPLTTPQTGDAPDVCTPGVSFYAAVTRHHAGKLRLRQGLRRMAEGGAALEPGAAHAACLPPQWLQQARSGRLNPNPALDELETLDASLLQMQTQALDAARRGHAAQALQDLAAPHYVQLSRRFVALLSDLHWRAAHGGRAVARAAIGAPTQVKPGANPAAHFGILTCKS